MGWRGSYSLAGARPQRPSDDCTPHEARGHVGSGWEGFLLLRAHQPRDRWPQCPRRPSARRGFRRTRTRTGLRAAFHIRCFADRWTPAMTGSAIELRIDCRNELGETPIWCAEASTLYWIDVIAPGRVFFWKTRTDAVDFWDFPELVTGIDLMDDGGLLVRGTSDIVRFDLITRWQQRLFALPDGSGSTRFNDGHCDRAGRLWVGTMSNNLLAGSTGGATSTGQIWCIGDGKASSIDAQLGCPNAICWSPDFRTFYIADSGNGWLYAHPFDVDTGTLMQRRTFFSSSTLGVPDGAAVD